MNVPFESEELPTRLSLVLPDMCNLIETLERVARDLMKLELSPMSDCDACSVAAASQAVHLALVELSPCA